MISSTIVSSSYLLGVVLLEIILLHLYGMHISLTLHDQNLISQCLKNTVVLHFEHHVIMWVLFLSNTSELHFYEEFCKCA